MFPSFLVSLVREIADGSLHGCHRASVFLVFMHAKGLSLERFPFQILVSKTIKAYSNVLSIGLKSI